MNTNPSETRRNLCQRQFSDGRRCRMLRMEGHPSLCPFHVREEKPLLEADKLGAELASLSRHLHNAPERPKNPPPPTTWCAIPSPPPAPCLAAGRLLLRPSHRHTPHPRPQEPLRPNPRPPYRHHRSLSSRSPSISQSLLLEDGLPNFPATPLECADPKIALATPSE